MYTYIYIYVSIHDSQYGIDGHHYIYHAYNLTHVALYTIIYIIIYIYIHIYIQQL